MPDAENLKRPIEHDNSLNNVLQSADLLHVNPQRAGGLGHTVAQASFVLKKLAGLL